MGDDFLCEAAGGDDRGFLAELFLDAVDDAVESSCAAVEDTALHALDGVLTNDVLRCVDADAAELGGTGGEGIERNTDTRQNHAADVLLLTVDDGNRGRGAHVNHDERHRVLIEAGDGVSDEIGTELTRVIHEDIETGLHARPQYHDFLLQNLLRRELRGVRDLRHNRGDDTSLDVAPLDVVDVEDGLQVDGVLKLRFRPNRREALDEIGLLIIDATDHDVCISDINR